jgi:replicative DNA helicase
MDNLNQYGYKFQVKVLTALITDRDFLTQSLDLIQPDYFESPALKWLVEKTYDYFKVFKLLPTIDVFKIQISNIPQTQTLREEVVNSLKEAFKEIESSDLKYIKETAIQFGQNQAIKQAFESSINDFQQGNYDSILSRFKVAIQKGIVNQNFGHNFIDDVEYRYTEEAEPERVKTGFEVLDEVTNGGLPKGCLGIIIAPSGLGKSWFLTKLGANAVKAGKTVLHYTLELADIYTAKRYDSLLNNIPFDDLKYHQDQVKNTVSKLKGKLFIKEFPPSTLSLTGLEAHLEKFVLAGHKPDLLIIDYPELLKIDFTGERDDKVLGQLYTDIRGLAGRFGVACWVVDQTNRQNSDVDIIENSGISNSFAKIFAADVVMSLSRRRKDKVNKTARLYLSKSRLGPDGLTFPGKFDTYSPIIEFYHPESEQGQKTKNETMSDSEYQQKVAAEEYQRQQNRKKQLF